MYSRKYNEIASIISEYNPFHKGHEFHIRKTKENTGAKYVIALMSGDFTQRGLPAVFDKFVRAEMALRGGADLVIELPCVYATSSAEGFAKGAVDLLNKLNCVDYLSFGSECGDVRTLTSCAKLLCEVPDKTDALIKEKIKEGLSYPRARQEAFTESSYDVSVLNFPNNILAIEYLRAMILSESKISPVTVKRDDNGYNSSEIDTSKAYNSASSIRRKIYDKDDVFSKFVPDNILPLYESSVSGLYDYDALIYQALLRKSASGYTDILDVNSDLSNRITKSLKDYETAEQFISILKSKNYTHSRLTRALIHILLDINNEPVKEASYARVLGFKKESAELLKILKDNSSLPIITKLADSKEYDYLSIDIKAANLYCNVNKTYLNEMRRSPVII